MVKSPWKLLTGLLSRGKSADQHNAGQTDLTEIPNEVEGSGANSAAAEPLVAGESAPELKPSVALQAGKGETGDRQEPPPSMAAEVPNRMPAEEVPGLARDRTVVVIGAERRNQKDTPPPPTRWTVKAEAPGHTRDAERAIASAVQAAPNEPDPVRALDSEIRELRSQLAVKLRVQNDQLRQMLSRFQPK